jgi:hypothetical protein
MIYIGVSQGLKMVQLEEPVITTIEETMVYKQVGKEPLLKMSKALMMVTKGNPEDSVEIERQYIIPRLA